MKIYLCQLDGKYDNKLPHLKKKNVYHMCMSVDKYMKNKSIAYLFGLNLPKNQKHNTWQRKQIIPPKALQK